MSVRPILLVLCSFLFASSGLGFAKEPFEIIDSAEVINVETDKEFIIELDANRTTGYQWQLAKPLDKNKVQLLNSEYKPAESKLAGAGGKEVWTFKAINPGKTIISLRYVRPWKKEKAMANKKHFVVIIKQGFCGYSSYGSCSQDSDCLRGGCSGQWCQSQAEPGQITTCEYKECYDAVKYNVQCRCINGQCQWFAQ